MRQPVTIRTYDPNRDEPHELACNPRTIDWSEKEFREWYFKHFTWAMHSGYEITITPAGPWSVVK